jgi:TRAP-type uncharacterized transport system substrate-binding protein
MIRKGIYWALWIIVAALAYKAAMWAYQGYKAGEQANQQQEILEIDKLCSVTPDTGQCVCRHRQTNRMISVTYDECVSRASGR